MGYIVVVIPGRPSADEAARELRTLAHDTFTRAMHERISTSVVTTFEEEVCDEYLDKGGNPETWPEALGGGFEPTWKVPYANAIVFGSMEVGEREARIVNAAVEAERMLAVRLPEGRLKRVTGVVGGRLTVDT